MKKKVYMAPSIKMCHINVADSLLSQSSTYGLLEEDKRTPIIEDDPTESIGGDDNDMVVW